MGIEKIKERVYVNTGYDGANVACIRTGNGLVLVDTPMLPKDIRQWRELIDDLEPAGVRYTITTHHHYDHIIGNEAMGGRVVMHESALARMREEGGTLREDMAPTAPGRTKEEVDFILSAPLVMPEIVFEDTMTLCLGSDVLRLVHAGGHSRGSICIYFENEKILFAGDNITSGMHPYKGDADFAQWIQALKWMKSLEIDFIVPGHGEVCKTDELNRFIEYFTRLWFMTQKMIQKGKGKKDIIKTVHEKMFGFFDVDPERLERAKIMFDAGTRRLYEEISAKLDFY